MLFDPSLGVGGGQSTALMLLLAVALDAAFGDPPRLYKIVPHPVALLGRLIGWLEGRLNDPGLSDDARRQRGLMLTAGVVGGALLVGALVHGLLRGFAYGWMIEVVLASTLIAFRGLHDAVLAVEAGLSTGLVEGRRAVGHIVGRDPDSLDQHGVARAAIESAAENFADGVIAPMFWYLLLGLPGLVAYKAINTLDSMLGYRDTRYAAFGGASARLDDLANWLPARLAGLIICFAAGFRPDCNHLRAWRAMRRDAPKHRSPNAGWSEAAMAGALGLALAGPRQYGGDLVADAWMGDGEAAATADDIRRARHLYLAAGAVTAAALAIYALY
ncbi:MAG: adenosylcobinamide-phosphate synthase CbiB [Alphaproteobacteria bacterium]|jgi:adenosylcobinamide-phosphate synthase|nr:adenosylcobinamide-phosphate synthase CbiB [Alphaproteobacteria bacterium]MDP6565067.1 adenosylcobinamide-phosphate synthase CbiB [Alphaproteobacteria bacterium]MDP6814789.1 adenosylcobinamide-phosphate synthase CbiB [Alphaproteobacteria bacterium]